MDEDKEEAKKDSMIWDRLFFLPPTRKDNIPKNNIVVSRSNVINKEWEKREYGGLEWKPHVCSWGWDLQEIVWSPTAFNQLACETGKVRGLRSAKAHANHRKHVVVFKLFVELKHWESLKNGYLRWRVWSSPGGAPPHHPPNHPMLKNGDVWSSGIINSGDIVCRSTVVSRGCWAQRWWSS